jgi:hypothetical protein
MNFSVCRRDPALFQMVTHRSMQTGLQGGIMEVGALVGQKVSESWGAGGSGGAGPECGAGALSAEGVTAG